MATPTGEGIKYITLRERPNQQNARGHFFQGGRSNGPILRLRSRDRCVVLRSCACREYSKPWQQIGIYTLASGVSLTRVLGPKPLFLPMPCWAQSLEWLIGRYVYHSHHARLER